jgi:putative flippase GtrA
MPEWLSYLVQGWPWFIYPIALGLALVAAYWASRQFVFKETTGTGAPLELAWPRPAIFLAFVALVYLLLVSLLRGAYEIIVIGVQVARPELTTQAPGEISFGLILVIDFLVILVGAILMLLVSRRRPTATREIESEEGEADE